MFFNSALTTETNQTNRAVWTPDIVMEFITIFCNLLQLQYFFCSVVLSKIYDSIYSYKVSGRWNNLKTKTTRTKRGERKKPAPTTNIIHMHGWTSNPIRWSKQRERLEYHKMWNTSSCFYEYWNKRTDGGDKLKWNTNTRQKKSKYKHRMRIEYEPKRGNIFPNHEALWIYWDWVL